MFGLGIASKEIFLAYSTQFVFSVIRLVRGNVVMVVIDMCGKSPITGEWIYGITWKHVYFNIFVAFIVHTTSYYLHTGCIVATIVTAVVVVAFLDLFFIYIFPSLFFLFFIYLFIYLFIYFFPLRLLFLFLLLLLSSLLLFLMLVSFVFVVANLMLMFSIFVLLFVLYFIVNSVDKKYEF